MDKTDYEEPRCPMDNSMWVKNKITSIPVGRVIEKEDEYLGKNDYAGAERHLLYWLEEAESGHDERGELVLFNELMGLHRKLGNGDKAKEYAQRALKTVEEQGLQNTVSGATAYLNSGTVYKAFNEPLKSLEYFEKAKAIYDGEQGIDPVRKAGLYNNMALTLVDLRRFDEARGLYESAVAMVKNENSAFEAITLLNLADCAVAEKGLEESEQLICEYLDRADELLDSVPESERDGEYAYSCEKCAPVFGYYGYFVAEKKFKNRAEEIYSSACKQ